jgi:hypothetical protein
MASTQRQDANDDFWRKLILPEEDRRRLFPTMTTTGYRWFRSPNVIPIEQWRARKRTVKAQPSPQT